MTLRLAFPVLAAALLAWSCSTTLCSSMTCPSGCCSMSGTCERGQLDVSCGKNGAACQPCGEGNRCVMSACEKIPVDAGPYVCGPTTCTGCCTAQNICLYGGEATLNTVCGRDGGLCADCTVTGLGQACVMGRCQ